MVACSSYNLVLREDSSQVSDDPGRYSDPQINFARQELYFGFFETKRTIFFAPVMVKYTKKNRDITKPRYGEQILTVPWPFIIIYRGSAVRTFNISFFFSGQHFSLQGNKGQLATKKIKIIKTFAFSNLL